MNSTKKWLAALLAAVLVFGNVVYALNRPLHAEEAEQAEPAPAEEAAPAAEPEVQSEPEITIEVVEQAPAAEPQEAPAAEPESKPEAPAAEAKEAEQPTEAQAPETTAPAESTKPEATTAPAESAKPEETKAPEATEKPAETAKYTFYGTDGETVLEKEYKLGETASAPADYRPGEVTWFLKGTENEFKDTVVNDCSPVEIEARENAAPTEDGADKEDKAEAGDAENAEKQPEKDSAEKPEKAAKKAEPERTIVVSASWEGEELFIGDVMTLKATLKGFEDVEYTLQWQSSADGESWTDVAGATGETLDVTMTEENCLYYWRVNAIIAEEAAEEDAAKTEDAAETEEPTEADEGAKTEDTAKTEEPTKTEDAAKTEEPAKTETPAAAESAETKSE